MKLCTFISSLILGLADGKTYTSSLKATAARDFVMSGGAQVRNESAACADSIQGPVHSTQKKSSTQVEANPRNSIRSGNPGS